MKTKTNIRLLTMLISFIAFANISFAADSVEITGNAYSEKIGLIHFDYKTAKNPDTTDTDLDDPSYYIGPTKQFNISPFDTYFDGSTTEKTFTPGDSSVISKVSTTDTNCDLNATDYRSGCLIQGFGWSDKIGWIVFDGSVINEGILDAGGADGDGDGIADDYPSKYWPRIKAEEQVTNPGRLAIVGFAWNEYTGWIRFSSDESAEQGIITNTKDQTDLNWGTWLDVEMDPDRVDISYQVEGTNFTKKEKLGRRINGYAWSENLGWIKFSSCDNSDGYATCEDIDFATYTLWVPDTTPPIPLAPEITWFATGVNTGYPDVTIQPSFISWEDFAIDPESGVDEFESKILVEAIAGETNPACPPPPLSNGTSVVGLMTYDLYDGTNNKPDYDEFGYGDLLRVVMPNVGLVQGVNDGFCKYKLNAMILNDVNHVTYIGDHFEPTPHATDKINYFDELILYVRAGDPADASNLVTQTKGVSIHGGDAYADGKDNVDYRVDLLDIAGNPVMDIDCTSEYVECPGREVVVTANITNELIYDLTEKASTNVIRPVHYGDSGPSHDLVFAEYDNDTNTNLGLSWPVAVYDTNTVNTWDIEVDKPDYRYYGLGLVSYAPSGDYVDPADPDDPIAYLSTKNFIINSFDYRLYNEEIPGYSMEMETNFDYNDPYDNWFKTNNWYSKTDACFDDDPGSGNTPKCDIPDFPTSPSDPPRVATAGAINHGGEDMQVDFDPPFDIHSGSLVGETGDPANPVITMSTPVEIEFTVENVSTQNILEEDGFPDTKGLFSVDNIFQFYEGTQAPGIHARYITNETAGETDSYYGWSDPFEYCSDCNRYEMWMAGSKIVKKVLEATDSEVGTGNPVLQVGDLLLEDMVASTTPFNNIFEGLGFHGGYKFWFYVNPKDANDNIYYKSMDEGLIPDTPLPYTASLPESPIPSKSSVLPGEIDYSEVDDTGLYFVTGKASIPKLWPYKGTVNAEGVEVDAKDPYQYDLSYIDRSDEVDLDLDSGSTKTKSIKFIPENYLKGNKVGSAKFRLVQEIGYRFEDQPIPTVYSTLMNELNNIDVMDTGLEAIGTVAGEKTVTGRQFDIVSTEGARKLQEQMRRNVAEMTAGFDETTCKLGSSENKILTTWPTDQPGQSQGACIVHESGKMYAYYNAPEGSLVTIGNGTDMTVPNQPYTLILRGGGSINIRSNIVYDTNSSFGMILIAEEAGKDQSNVFIDPAPTNIEAVLYAEGSVISSDSAGKIYYGPTGSPDRGDIKDLANQLYWRGSIASRNTIAGAGQSKLPPGVKANCLSDDTDFSCAQRYDFDYLRRFTVLQDNATAPTETTIANNGKFSGGGTCDNGTKTCVCATCAPLGNLPTIINLVAGQIQPDSEIAAVFVEKDPSTINNPPPGFTVTGGLESLQVIR